MASWLPMNRHILWTLGHEYQLDLVRKTLVTRDRLRLAMSGERELLDRHRVIACSASCILLARHRAVRSGCIRTDTQTHRHTDTQTHRHSDTDTYPDTHTL
jgi:hypothetical protein